jgi:predicted transcriptional regulator
MKLNKTDVLLLGALTSGPQKTSDIAEKMALSRGRTSTILKKLIDLRLVAKRGWNYEIAQSSQGSMIRAIIKRNPSLRLEKILQATEYNILCSLSKGSKTPREIAEEIEKTVRTVYLKLETFKSMGLVVDLAGGTYAINSGGSAYRDIMALLAGGFVAPPFALEESAGWVAWSGMDEYLLRTGNPGELIKRIGEKGMKWKYASMSALSRHGIHLIPPETTLYVYAGIDKIKYSGQYPSVEDTIIHLMLDNAEKAPEYAKWLLILHKDRVDPNRLRKTAKIHGLSKQIDGLLYDLKPVLGT